MYFEFLVPSEMTGEVRFTTYTATHYQGVIGTFYLQNLSYTVYGWDVVSFTIHATLQLSMLKLYKCMFSDCCYVKAFQSMRDVIMLSCVTDAPSRYTEALTGQFVHHLSPALWLIGKTDLNCNTFKICIFFEAVKATQHITGNSLPAIQIFSPSAACSVVSSRTPASQ